MSNDSLDDILDNIDRSVDSLGYILDNDDRSDDILSDKFPKKFYRPICRPKKIIVRCIVQKKLSSDPSSKTTIAHL